MSEVNTNDLVFLLSALVRKKYANKIIEKYENLIWKIIHKKLPGYTGGKADIPMVAKEDVFGEVVEAFLEMVNKGKFKGEHGEPSAVACIQDITRKKCANFIRWFKKERKQRAWGNPEDGGNPWFENLLAYEQHVEKKPVEKYESKVQDEIILKEAKHLDILRLRKEGCTIPEIVRILEITEGQVRGRIIRERERLSRETKSLGWADPKPDLDESIKLVSSPSPYFDKTIEELEPNDFPGRLDHTLPAGKERKVEKHGGFQKGHVELINRMRKVQHSNRERFCVKCGKLTKEQNVVLDNTLVYCKECHKNLKKYK